MINRRKSDAGYVYTLKCDHCGRLLSEVTYTSYSAAIDAHKPFEKRISGKIYGFCPTCKAALYSARYKEGMRPNIQTNFLG